MICSTSEPQSYTILFQKLAEARSALDEAQRDEADRVMQESEEIKTVRELAEAAGEPAGMETYTRA